MRREWIYRPVPGSDAEALRSEPAGRGSHAGPTMLCMDVGRDCTRAICPISAPPLVIRGELARLRRLADE